MKIKKQASKLAASYTWVR